MSETISSELYLYDQGNYYDIEGYIDEIILVDFHQLTVYLSFYSTVTLSMMTISVMRRMIQIAFHKCGVF